jgi:hypothetical protein
MAEQAVIDALLQPPAWHVQCYLHEAFGYLRDKWATQVDRKVVIVWMA